MENNPFFKIFESNNFIYTDAYLSKFEDKIEI